MNATKLTTYMSAIKGNTILCFIMEIYDYLKILFSLSNIFFAILLKMLMPCLPWRSDSLFLFPEYMMILHAHDSFTFQQYKYLALFIKINVFFSIMCFVIFSENLIIIYCTLNFIENTQVKRKHKESKNPPLDL